MIVPIRFEITHEEVVLGAVKSVLGRLYPLVDTREHILDYRERFTLVVPEHSQDYGTTPLNNATGLFVQELCQDWPHWIWFLSREDDSLHRFMVLVCANALSRGSKRQDSNEESTIPNRRIRIRLQNLIERSEWLLADFDLPHQLLQESSASAQRKLGLSD